MDRTLNECEFRVQPVWDESESGHTIVTAVLNEQLLKTSMPGVAPYRSGAVTEQPEDDSTVVRPRIVFLYNVEVWRGGVRQSVVPITSIPQASNTKLIID